MTNIFPPVRDISKTAINILQKRYFAEGETSWSQVSRRVVDYVLKNADPEDKELTYQMIDNRYFVPNSPCLANSGKKDAGLCACFVVDFPDTIEGIYKTKLDFALIARKGGGCGTTLSKIRPEGSKVSGSTHGYAGGPIKFADTISHDAEALTQGGFRSMAIMFTMSVYHPDIINFITAKSEEGKIANANISVVVDDAFMEKVENDENYWTEFNGIKYKEYKARDIFNLVVEGSWRNGEPALLYKSRIDNSPYKYTGQEILATNPCLFKDSILDDGNTLNCVNSLRGLKSWKTGNKKCIKLITNAGHEIILTPNHKIMLEDKTFIEAKDSINKSIMWGLGNKTTTINKNYQIAGFLFGDGFLCGGSLGISVKLDEEKEKEIYQKLLSFGFYKESCSQLYINKNDLEKNLNIDLSFMGEKTYNKEFPKSILFEDHNILGSFLSGLYEANGSISEFSNIISFKSTSKNLVKDIQIALGYFGIQSWICPNVASLIHWNNGDYTSKISYNLQIAPRNAYKFKERIGFISNKKNDKIKKLEKPYKGKLIVTKIENIDEELEVWDFKTDIGYNYANGIIAHNCSEQPLPPNGVCNLGSLALSKFLNKNNELDLEKLEIAVRLSVRFLDTVVDVSSYPTAEIAEWAKNNRAIGLGIMGFADYCLMKEIPYGSEESLKELEIILSFINKISENESIKLGIDLGIPKYCWMLPVPRRNITLGTVAPTGTISIFAGDSSGIEPVFSEITIRNDKTGTYTFENDLADKPYFRCAVSSNGAKEVTWEEHIRVLATAQRHIDSGVSKTINFPTNTHRETIGKAFIMAWKLGCKGLAVYRNGSRKVEVLTPKNMKKDKCPVCGEDLIFIDNCKKCSSSSCAWNFCGE